MLNSFNVFPICRPRVATPQRKVGLRNVSEILSWDVQCYNSPTKHQPGELHMGPGRSKVERITHTQIKVNGATEKPILRGVNFQYGERFNFIILIE